MMKENLEIIELGHNTLRLVAETINTTEITSKPIQKLIVDMKYTLQKADGLGIAAPQVGISKQIFIIASKPNKRYPLAPNCAPFAIVNPVIIKKSEEMINDWEGCLSIPGIRGLVPRHQSIKVKYFDEKGKEQEQEFSDFIARIFQHEYDHLQGVVFIDRLESRKDLATDKEYLKRINYSKE